MEVSEAFGQVLRKHRKVANLSQEQLALHCELDRTYIGLLERAQRQPSISTIFSICEVLEVQPHILIKEVEELINNK
ncbi:helix-turn-helix transcriptional regulator [Peribacillus frigoritolerans]|uniref:helix-turn-helix domain-containing protein n=1 Tax=Peribacillus frigoritolerans TaxID=450367 RepID=UPI00345D9C22